MEQSVKSSPVNLTDDRLDPLRQGEVVRIPVPELGGDLLMILAAPQESTERVLEESLQDVREQRAWVAAGRKAILRQIREDSQGPT